MNRPLRNIKNLFCSLGRIFGTVGGILLAVILLYFVWNPGNLPTKRLPAKELAHGIWLSHNWLADNAFYKRNRRDSAFFRNTEKRRELFRKLKQHHIHYVFPHMCPAGRDGKLPGYDDLQMESFLTLADEFKIEVIPWVGGVLDESARIHDRAWRTRFCAAVKNLLSKHNRIAGIQLNVEPLRDGDSDFLLLLDELKIIVENRKLSVAGYPPPTCWQPNKNVHWSPDYLRKVAQRTDLLCVMMYDTGIRYEKFYIHLMRNWTGKLLKCAKGLPCKILFGIPAYNDAGVGYHDPEVENISSALIGIFAGIEDHKNSPVFGGFAIYCEWEMDQRKWNLWDSFFNDSYRKIPIDK